MAQLEGIRIQNYRALKNVVLGRTFENRDDERLPRMVAIIGPNGSGKSTVMDALGFIGDCLRFGVEEACDQPHRGGFEKLRTRGQTGSIEFEIYYRESSTARPISYSLHINKDNKGRPTVVYERFRQRRKGEGSGQPFSFLEVRNGKGYAWAGESTATEEGNERKDVKLDDARKLGVTTLGNLTEHPRIVAFRKFLEGWYQCVTSVEVLKEAGLGDVEMSRRRLEALSGLTILAVDKSARSLARELLAARILPPAAASDAIHAVVAAQRGINILLTWNCRHLANPHLLGKLREFMWRYKLTLPEVCTPIELMGG